MRKFILKLAVLNLFLLIGTLVFAQDDQEELPPLIFADFFSPNGDNNNDTFVILNVEEYPNNSIEIFNRWGEKVYSAKPYDNSWNGTSSKGIISNDLPEGTYFYVFNDGFGNDIKGKITLKRSTK
jgi:gliding motility-associated-like protein